MTYAIIALGGKQYRVREGEWLLVDRLPQAEGATFSPEVLLVGGDKDGPKFGADAKVEVTATVTEHLLGKKIVVGKHRQRVGYRRRNGHRSRLSKIEIQSIGAKTARRAPTKKDETAEKPKTAPKPRAAAKPKAATTARKPAAKPKTETEGKAE